MTDIPADYDTFVQPHPRQEATPGFRRSWSPESDALLPEDYTNSYTRHANPLHPISTHRELPTLPSTFGLQTSTSSGYNIGMLLQRVRELEMRNTTLTQQMYELRGELTGARAAYDLLLARLPTDDVLVASSSDAGSARVAPPSTPIEAALLAVRNHPPIITLNRTDYRLVRFWHRSDFTNWVSEKTKASTLEAQEGSLQYKFLESEDGECIREQKKKLMLETLYAAWHSLLHAGLLPDTWGRASIEVRMYVWATMEAAFVELRFCDGHWKTQLLATLNYPWWSSKHLRRITIGGAEEGDGGGDDKKMAGGGRRSLKVARKRAAPDTAEVAEESAKKPKKIKSVFGNVSSESPSPSSAVTGDVTSTAVIDAPPLLPTTTTTSRETPPSTPASTAHDDAVSNGPAEPSAPSLQEHELNNLIAPDPQAGAFDTRAWSSQDMQAPLTTLSAHGPSSILGTSSFHDPSPSSIRESSSAREPAVSSPSASAPIDDDFVYPSISTPAAGKESAPAVGVGPATAPSQAVPAPLDSAQRIPCPQSESVTPFPGSTSIPDGAQASASPAEGPTGKKTTAYMLCRQNFERAHPGVGKKDMTKLFKEHWKQMAKTERKEWDEKAKRANGSQVQAAQATAAHT